MPVFEKRFPEKRSLCVKSLSWRVAGPFGSASEDGVSRGSRTPSAKMPNVMESTKGRKETEDGEEAMWQGRAESKDEREKAGWERKRRTRKIDITAPLMALAQPSFEQHSVQAFVQRAGRVCCSHHSR